jgi:hypothetical protein
MRIHQLDIRAERVEADLKALKNLSLDPERAAPNANPGSKAPGS